MNHFAEATAAARYALGRPYFHPLVIENLKRLIPVDEGLGRGLDVGCGTAQSSMALAELAAEVAGVDSAPQMLAAATAHPRIRYVAGSAEALPIAAGSVGLITVGLAFHWFDRDAFLGEAARVLKVGECMVIYADGMVGGMEGDARYGQWNREHYVSRFPTPLETPRALAMTTRCASALRRLPRKGSPIGLPFSPGLWSST